MPRHGIESAHPYGLGYCKSKSRHQPYLTLPMEDQAVQGGRGCGDTGSDYFS